MIVTDHETARKDQLFFFDFAIYQIFFRKIQIFHYIFYTKFHVITVFFMLYNMLGISTEHVLYLFVLFFFLSLYFIAIYVSCFLLSYTRQWNVQSKEMEMILLLKKCKQMLCIKKKIIERYCLEKIRPWTSCLSNEFPLH